QGGMLRQGAAQQPPPLVEAIDKVFPISELPREGKARVVLMEVSDFTCPDCIKHAKETAPALEEMVKDGKISHVFIDNPGPRYRDAMKFAQESLCSLRQSKTKYWETIPIIFDLQPAAVPEEVSRTAGLNLDEFQRCLNDPWSLRYLDSLITYQR